MKTRRIADLAADFEADPAPLDLLPELAQARALYTDFVERFDELQAALLAWHESYQAGAEGVERRPRQVLDPTAAMRLLGDVTKIAKRIEDISASNAISRADFHRVLHEMGRVVDQEIPDEDARRRIVEGWRQIRIA